MEPTTPNAAPAAVDTTQAIEPQAAPSAPPAEPEKKIDGKAFAALTRQEKQLRAQQAEWKAKREQEEREWSSKIEDAKRFQDTRSKAKTDRALALQALQELGLSYEDLTQLVLNDNKPTAEMLAKQAMEEAQAVKKQFEDRDRKAQELETKAKQDQEAQAVELFKGEIGKAIAADAELLLTADDIDLVYQVIDRHYKDTARVMTNEEAIALVDKWRQDEIKEKWAGKAKLKEIFGAVGAESGAEGGDANTVAPVGGVPGSAKPQPVATLTNAVQTNAPTPTKSRALTPEESKAEAAKLLKWN